MNLRYALICDYARQTVNNKSDLFGVFDAYFMTDEQLGREMPTFVVYAVFEGAENVDRRRDIHVQFKIIGPEPENRVLFEDGGQAQLPEREAYPGRNPGITLAVQVTGLAPYTHGLYRVRFNLNGEDFDGPTLMVRPPTNDEVRNAAQ